MERNHFAGRADPFFFGTGRNGAIGKRASPGGECCGTDPLSVHEQGTGHRRHPAELAENIRRLKRILLVRKSR